MQRAHARCLLHSSRSSRVRDGTRAEVRQHALGHQLVDREAGTGAQVCLTPESVIATPSLRLEVLRERSERACAALSGEGSLLEEPCCAMLEARGSGTGLKPRQCGATPGVSGPGVGAAPPQPVLTLGGPQRWRY